MLFINLNLEPLLALGELGPKMEKALRQGGAALASATHAHLVEEANQKLHTSRQKYIDALSFSQVDDDTWVVELAPEAFWIEDGIPPNTSMVDWFLGKPKGVKTAKDGSKFKVIPLEHNKGPSQQTEKQKSLTDMLRSEMKARMIPYGGLEKDKNGRPKTGLLHSFDVTKTPQGKPVPLGKSGASMLQGVRVYQQNVMDKKTGKSSVKKSILTFRVASSKHKGTDRWVHPGTESHHFLEKAFEWAQTQWSKMVEEIVSKEQI